MGQGGYPNFEGGPQQQPGGDFGGRGSDGFMGDGGGPDGASPDDVPSTSYCAEVADWDDDAANAEQELFRFVNFARESGFACGSDSGPSLPALVLAPELRCSARLHSKDMFENDYLGYVDGDGNGPEERILATGYTFVVAGESIEQQGSAEPMMHPYQDLADLFDRGGVDCENLVDERFTAVGVGVHADLVTLDFAGP
jgi:uncharacterized protein YkwD